jgi:hypothetical protein
LLNIFFTKRIKEPSTRKIKNTKPILLFYHSERVAYFGTPKRFDLCTKRCIYFGCFRIIKMICYICLSGFTQIDPMV